VLKLCLALPTFHPTFAGGPLRFLRYQPRMRLHDIHACVLAGTAREKALTPEEARLRWHEQPIGRMLPPECIEGVPVRRVRLPDRTSVRRTSIYFRALLEHCEAPATRPDVIQLHSFERLEALYWLRRLRRLDIPLLYAIQIARPLAPERGLRRRLRKSMLRDFYGLFDGIATSSERIRGSLLDLGVRTPIEVIPNGVDLGRFRPVDAEARRRVRQELGIEEGAPVVLAVGAVSPRKGSDLLVEAFRTLSLQRPEAQLLFVGPRHDRRNQRLGGFEARLEQLVRECPAPDRIRFMGVRDDLPRLYAAADVVVLPTDREGGTPNVVLEAMACARPVLLTRFEGQSAALGRPGVEFAQAPRSPEGLAESLSRLVEDRQRREALARNGLEWVRRRLDVQHSVDRFADLYRRAAARTLSTSTPAPMPMPMPMPIADGHGIRARDVTPIAKE
jgi:glycosyltransferase involved in cell wall biosynthesis